MISLCDRSLKECPKKKRAQSGGGVFV